MLVKQILVSKGNNDLHWLRPEASVADAARMMSVNRIGTCIVSYEGDDLQGILSERDIVREIGKRGETVLGNDIASIMTSKIVTCAETDNSDHVLETMTNGRFRHMPVMDAERVIGLISIGDVVKARITELAMEKDALEGMIMGH